MTWEVIGGFVGASRAAVKNAVQRAYPSQNEGDESGSRAETQRKRLSHARSVLREATPDVIEQIAADLTNSQRENISRVLLFR